MDRAIGGWIIQGRFALELLEPQVDQVTATGNLEQHEQRRRRAEQRFDAQASRQPPEHGAAGHPQGGEQAMAPRTARRQLCSGEKVRSWGDHRHAPEQGQRQQRGEVNQVRGVHGNRWP